MSTERLVGPALGPGLALALAAFLAGCRQDMHDQPKYRPLRPSAFFRDGRASRPLVAGTVARGQLGEVSVPPPVTQALLRRGQERFDIYCAPCHDRVGTGNGMIVQRGFKRPPSLHVDRLRQIPDSYLFQVITQGFGVMPSYAAQVPVADRWAITGYIRALQLSQNARLDDLPAAERRRLETGGE